MQNTETTNKESCFLQLLAGVEDLAEKKMKIYSRLLMDAALAGDMETLAVRHAKRKTKLESLAFGKTKCAEKRKNEVGRCDAKDEEETE